MGVSSSIASGSANVFHAFDSIDKTHFTFLLAPTALRRDQFFALELTKAADIIMFVVCNDALNELSTVIDEVYVVVLSWRSAQSNCCSNIHIDWTECFERDEGDGLP